MGAGITIVVSDIDVDITVTPVIENHTNDRMANEVPTVAAVDDDTCAIDTTLMDHLCTRNHDGSLGAMDSDGHMLLMKQ